MDATSRVVAGWILEERLGHGGFGEVWKARRPHTDLPRALKLVPVHDEPAFRAWRQEAHRLDELSHPNIVRFYDADLVTDPGPYQDHAWIATELCEHSLADELLAQPGHVLPPAEVAPLVEAMLGALAAAHARGCVHRDVKPGNILRHRSGVWKLCDFGTARLIPPGESHPRTDVVGTSPYMSPAAHRGQQDPAADLYALGVTVHEALCGTRLHLRPGGMTDSEYVRLILDSPPRLSPDLAPAWRPLVTALVGLDGPHTAAELLTRLPDPTAEGPDRTAGAAAAPSPPLPTPPAYDRTTVPQPAVVPPSPEHDATRRYDGSPVAPPTASRRQDAPPARAASRRRHRSREHSHARRLGALIAGSLLVAGVLLLQAFNAVVAGLILLAAVLVVLALVLVS